MKLIYARNVQQALPKGLRLLRDFGLRRGSRNGPVIVAPWPVVTVYEQPLERVVFWPQRDANPFFHFFESLWMLAGRQDLQPLTRYVRGFGEFSDDGETLHGAYGYRWRQAFRRDQLDVIADRLRRDPDDRRCVLQMWHADLDLDRNGRDLPCNLMATVQRDVLGRLDLTVFCRSNDIIWGAYGANAVQFGFLLEYLAIAVGCQAGTYRQVSVNWHAYEDLFSRMAPDLIREAFSSLYAIPSAILDPYAGGKVAHIQMSDGGGPEASRRVDAIISELLMHDGTEFALPRSSGQGDPWAEMAYTLLRAHHAFRTLRAPDRYRAALDVLAYGDQRADWIVAAQQWIERRQVAWEAKRGGADQVEAAVL